jgi:hypothetical protein
MQNESSSINSFHQNIRGLRSKGDELIHSFETDSINSCMFCLSEHHMVEQELGAAAPHSECLAIRFQLLPKRTIGGGGGYFC